jgi:hypothetical protein
MSPPKTITGTVTYTKLAAFLVVHAASKPDTTFLLLMDSPPGGNTIPTQTAAARSYLVNHDYDEGDSLSVYGVPDVVGTQPVIHIIKVM